MIEENVKNELLNFAKECREKYIPVVREQTAKILCDLIEKKQPKKILEIGTAVGYSGTLMLLSSKLSTLTTVELSEDNCKIADDTFKKYNLNERVVIKNCDAIKFFEENKDTFDFIFLDGPKGQYIKYYPYFETILNECGVIFCDDVLYFGMVLDDSKVIHKKITIVRNLRQFINNCQNNPNFQTKLLEIEDGILILEKI